LEDAKSLVQMENSPLLLINNHIMYNLESVEDNRVENRVATRSEVACDIDEEQQLLVDIRNSSLELHPKDLDADDMTEQTSRTDDDILREAFKAVDNPEVIADEEDEDQVVYMRSSLSPTLSPVLHPAPATPVKPMLSPKNISPRSPTHYQSAKITSFGLSAPIPPGTTTAQDLLNDVMGMGMSSGHRSINGGPHQPFEQPKFLFGNELSHRPSQSIWSASLDEQPLMYSGNGSSANGGPNGLAGPGNGHANNIPTNHPGANLHSSGNLSGGSIYQTPSRQFPVVHGSQDLSLSQQSIWSSSYSSNSQNSQQNGVGALPSAPFAQPPQIGLGGHGGHNRIPSASLSSQLYSNHKINNQINLDPFGYTSPVMQQAPIHRPEPNLSSSGYLSSSIGHGSLPPIGAASGLGLAFGGPTGQAYYTSPNQGYHTRQLSMHDPRVGQQSYMSPVSQVWGNNG